MDAATFRRDLPEFTDPVKYPGAQVTFFLGLGAKLVDAGRWADVYDQGVELFAAHWLALWRERMDAAARGAIPGKNVGIQNNKSVDKVSVGYDVGGATLPDAGHWNLTTYGTQFRDLLMMFGAGPIQVGVASPDEILLSAWVGPPAFNFPNPSG